MFQGGNDDAFQRVGRSISAPSHNNLLRQARMHSWMNGLRAIPDRIGRAVNSGRHQKGKRSSQPYLDEEGNICQDKMEMMQHVEYDTQIHCKVIPICQYVEQNPLNMRKAKLD